MNEPHTVTVNLRVLLMMLEIRSIVMHVTITIADPAPADPAKISRNKNADAIGDDAKSGICDFVCLLENVRDTRRHLKNAPRRERISGRHALL